MGLLPSAKKSFENFEAQLVSPYRGSSLAETADFWALLPAHRAVVRGNSRRLMRFAVSTDASPKIAQWTMRSLGHVADHPGKRLIGEITPTVVKGYA
jgi:hypothetical protein